MNLAAVSLPRNVQAGKVINARPIRQRRTCGRTANGPAGFGDPALHTAADLASGHRQGTPKASEGGLGGRIAGRLPRCRYARQASAGRFNPMGAEGGHPARVGQAPERRGK